jgi:predicted nucleic acid-binding protein
LCVIVDASVAGQVFSNPHKADFQPLWRWLEEKGGKLVYGGYLVEELSRTSATRMLSELKRSGRALVCSSKKIDQAEKDVRKLKLCRSNDLHIIALARASGARVLCTNDHKLEDDFKNLKIVPRPKGQIYKKAEHAHLLTHNNVCIGRPRS